MNPELLRFMKKTIVQFGEEFEDNKFVMQFIPIVLMLLFSLYTHRFIEIANSVLGKLFAVVVIIFYTKLNILYGVFACMFIILFYQLTANIFMADTIVFEGMKNPKKSSKSDEKPSNKVATQVPSSAVVATYGKSTATNVSPLVAAPLVAAAGTSRITTSQEDDDVEDGTNLQEEDDVESNDMDIEGFESYKNLYPVINIDDFNAAKDEFIKEKCRNGVIMYKDMPVKPEMVDHVFSEVHFTTDTKCNPCDRTCAYSIIENKLATEEELGRPKNSNDVFEWFTHLFTKHA